MTEAQTARQAMRRNEWTGMTVYRVPGFVQCNLVVLPHVDAYDFLVYCQRNPKACPLIDVTDPGDPEPKRAAPGADLRTDLARYAVYRDGARQADVTDITDLWRPDSVGFLIGSSLTFDEPLERAGVPKGPEVWVLRTKIQTERSGKFRGPLVVTMRLMTPQQAVVATQLTSRFPFNHGAPVHVGDPALIGADIQAPLNGKPMERIPDGLTAVFWACGVTPQLAAVESKAKLMITHASGYGFITDLRRPNLHPVNHSRSVTMTVAAADVPASTNVHQQFDDRGYVILRNFIPRSVIDGVKQDCAGLVEQLAQKLKAEGKITDLCEREPFETRLIGIIAQEPDAAARTLRRELHLPHMFDLFGHAPLLDIVEQLLGPEIRLYPNYSVRPKLPEDPRTEVLWHQDAGYTHGETERLRMVNVWTPLVPATVENGCMQFVPATHKLGPVPHNRGEHYLVIQDEYLKPRLKDAVNIEMELGDIVLFSNLLFHVGLPNRSKMVRWSADWRYQDATQSTLRAQSGHLVRSKLHPDEVVKDSADWAQRKFQ